MKKDLNLILSYTKEQDECLIWTRCFNTDGYPRAVIDGDNNSKVHRVVWELKNNKSATGMVIRHSCDNPKCINPDHLFLGTVLDNINDMDSRDRRQGLKMKDVILIRQMRNELNYSVAQIANYFNVSKNTIYYSLLHRKVGT